MKRRGRLPQRKCPVCGLDVSLPSIRAHVASEPCIARFKRNHGVAADPDRGALALELARKLDRVLREGPA